MKPEVTRLKQVFEPLAQKETIQYEVESICGRVDDVIVGDVSPQTAHEHLPAAPAPRSISNLRPNAPVEKPAIISSMERKGARNIFGLPLDETSSPFSRRVRDDVIDGASEGRRKIGVTSASTLQQKPTPSSPAKPTRHAAAHKPSADEPAAGARHGEGKASVKKVARGVLVQTTASAPAQTHKPSKSKTRAGKKSGKDERQVEGVGVVKEDSVRQDFPVEDTDTLSRHERILKWLRSKHSPLVEFERQQVEARRKRRQAQTQRKQVRGRRSQEAEVTSSKTKDSLSQKEGAAAARQPPEVIVKYGMGKTIRVSGRTRKSGEEKTSDASTKRTDAKVRSSGAEMTSSPTKKKRAARSDSRTPSESRFSDASPASARRSPVAKHVTSAPHVSNELWALDVNTLTWTLLVSVMVQMTFRYHADCSRILMPLDKI